MRNILWLNVLKRKLNSIDLVVSDLIALAREGCKAWLSI